MNPTANTALRGVVPSTYVLLLYDYLDRQGQDAEQLLGQPRPDPGPHQLARFPVADWRRLLETARHRLDDPQLALHLGQSITTAHFGVIGYLLLACGDLGGALARFDHYQRLIYDVNPMRRDLEGANVVLEWGAAAGRPGALVDETAIAVLVQFARDLTGQRLQPAAVSFINPAPADPQPLADWLGVMPRWSAPSTRVAIPVTALTLPLRQQDPALLKILETQAEALLAELPAGSDALHQVRQAILRRLRDQSLSLDRIAADLHCAPRSLHRQLAAEGCNFRGLCEQTRRQLAEGYLADPRLQLAEIALLLGYSEQSAFTRAFRRWTGSSPARWRAAAAG